MLKLILKDEKTEIKKIRLFLESSNLNPQNFLGDYGTLAFSESLKNLEPLRKKALKLGINCCIIKEKKTELPPPLEISKLELTGGFLKFGGNPEKTILTADIKILALGAYKKEVFFQTPFAEGKSESIELALLGAAASYKEIFFVLDILTDKRRFRLTCENTISRPAIGEIFPNSFENFSKAALFLKGLRPETANKTLNLLLEGKNIQYLVYEDLFFFDKELKWLDLIRKESAKNKVKNENN